MRFLVPALALLLVVGSSAAAADPPDATLRQQVETIIQEYLKAHPEVVVDAFREMERREREAEGRRRAALIRGKAAELYQDPGSPVGGNPKGNVTLVEFFDYQCGYCKRVEGELAKLLQADPEVRLVYKEWPILGPESVVAARAALAAHQQGKYQALHQALMGSSDRLTEEAVMALASGVGLDVVRLRQDMESAAVRQELVGTAALAQALGLRGTPALIAGTELHPGAADLPALQRLIERARRSAGSAP